MKKIIYWFEAAEEKSLKIETSIKEKAFEDFVSALEIPQSVLCDNMDIIVQICMNPSKE